MKQEAIMKIFRECGAYHKGHFKLSSGLHSEYYLQCALVLAYPKVAAKLCGELAKKFRGKKIIAIAGEHISFLLKQVVDIIYPLPLKEKNGNGY